MKRRPVLVRLPPVVAAALLVPGLGVAQSEGGERTAGIGGVEEVIVTAQRRSQNVKDVPISITAVDQATMDRRSVRRIDDLTRIAPGVDFNRGDARNSGNSTIAIRGITSNGGAETTGIYIDEMPIQIRRLGFSVSNTYPRVVDLERVEVLRGPQGTLFGAGSEGGTVRFITPAPSLKESSGFLRTELASTRYGEPSYEVGAAYGAPIVEDRLAFRGSASYRRDGGWIDRVNYADRSIVESAANWEESTVARAAIAYAPTDNVLITPSVYYQKVFQNTPSVYWDSLSDASEGDFLLGNPLSAWNRDRFLTGSLKIDVKFDFADFVSVTSYFDRDQENLADYTTLDRAVLLRNPLFPPGAEGRGDFKNTQQNFAQEVRLQANEPDARLQWVVGLFFGKSRQNAVQRVADVTLPQEFLALTGLTFEQVFGQGLADGRYIYVQDPYKGTDEQIASFAQLDFAATERLTLMAGLRVARTKFSGSAGFGGPFGGIPFQDSGSQSETPLTPRIGARFEFGGGNNVYATVSKGYRVGGYNPGQLSICQTQLDQLGIANEDIPVKYDSDELWNYEIGAKTTWLEQRVGLDASVFYIDWKDIQQFVTLSSCGGGFVSNLGTATSKGFDLQASLKPIEALTFSLGVGYTDAKYNDTVYPGTPNPGRALVSEGDHIPGSPWSASLSAQYQFAILALPDTYLQLDYQYKGRQSDRVPSQNLNNGLSFSRNYFPIQEVNFASARLGTKWGAANIALFVDNLFDADKPISRGSEGGNLATPLFRVYTLRPRTIGLHVNYSFGH